MPIEPGAKSGSIVALSGTIGSTRGRASTNRNITALSAGSLNLLWNNPNRIWALFVNIGAYPAHVSLGEAATLTDPAIFPGGSFIIDKDHPWTGAVYVIAETADTALGGWEVEAME